MRIIAGLCTLFFIFGCAESEQQRWAKKSDWNFMINTCIVTAGSETVEVPDCSQKSAAQAALASPTHMVSYNFLGPNEYTLQIFVSPNHPNYSFFNDPKFTQVRTMPVDYIKGEDPDTLAVVLHSLTGCDITTNYRLSEPGKVFEQAVSAVGASCDSAQKRAVEDELRDGPTLKSFNKG